MAEAPLGHRLWRHEMFSPLLMLNRVRDREQAMQLANDSDLGLAAGFYGGADEVAWFHEHIEAGVTYANRRQGATTGAWPGYQPFAGWKGSSSTGKRHVSLSPENFGSPACRGKCARSIIDHDQDGSMELKKREGYF